MAGTEVGNMIVFRHF